VDSGHVGIYLMSTRWENVVSLAREVDAAIVSGKALDMTLVARLARAVLDFEGELNAGPPAGGRTPSRSG
jgi:hypothetical protein